MELPAWMGEPAKKKKQNSRSAAHERRLAKETGGRPTSGSGSSWRAPQDVRSETHLLQHKYTDKGSFTITVKEWEGIVADADRAGKDPGLVIDFDKYGVSVVVVPYQPRGG